MDRMGILVYIVPDITKAERERFSKAVVVVMVKDEDLAFKRIERTVNLIVLGTVMDAIN